MGGLWLLMFGAQGFKEGCEVDFVSDSLRGCSDLMS